MSKCVNCIAFFDDDIKGTVSFHQCDKSSKVIVIFNLFGFKPNMTHAIHIHEFGDMSNGCMSLGKHFNLHNDEHGSLFIKNGKSHTGDLINNLHTDNKGYFKYSYIDPRLNIIGDISKSIIGRSVVIHEGIDDLGLGSNAESKITGNAGGRMTCAVIGHAKNGKL
jgi:Cu-Zn family superoxide dismutase